MEFIFFSEQKEAEEVIPLICKNSSPQSVLCQTINHFSSQHTRRVRCIAVCPINDHHFVTRFRIIFSESFLHMFWFDYGFFPMKILWFFVMYLFFFSQLLVKYIWICFSVILSRRKRKMKLNREVTLFSQPIFFS